MIENPFKCSGNWYRANLHAHTTRSDGDISPEGSAELYRKAGYDILAITDHGHVTETSGPPGLLLLSGVELGGGRTMQGTWYHIVGLGVRARGKLEEPANASAQDLVDLLREQGGEAFIAHPYWSGLMAQEMATIQGCFALEVYNTGCDLEVLRGYSMVQWDDLLTLGHDLGGLAVDDGHWSKKDHGLGWTMIRAEELSAEAVLEALRRGRYYASTGPEIREMKIVGEKLVVETSPVESIALVSAPELGDRKHAPKGDSITSAEFALPQARYCRVETIDHAGRRAWSNPLGISQQVKA